MTDATTLAPAPVAEPFTVAELGRDFVAVRAWAAQFFASFGTDEFFAARDGAWSPADHVRHLIKSNRPVARALDLPRVLLLLRFGFTTRASRSYTALVSSYREALNDGLKAGSFAPSPLTQERHSDAERQEILQRWSDSLLAVETAAAKWSERSLDRLRLPHPGLGLLTVREMLFFTLYHNTHHAKGVAARYR
jgi:hypothetical protein